MLLGLAALALAYVVTMIVTSLPGPEQQPAAAVAPYEFYHAVP
jgi:hypothetical protein